MVAPEVKVGDVFTRVDRNGGVWKAEVIRRTDCFVDVKKTRPYAIKVGGDDITGWHYENLEPIVERAALNEEKILKPTGGLKKTFFGKEVPETTYAGTGKYFINLKEECTARHKYDRCYILEKYAKPLEVL